jgi:uncharacterized protein (DUF736 family)
MLFSAREHLASDWPDLAEGRLRLDRPNRNRGGANFSPGLCPFLTPAKKVSPPPSSAVLRPNGCGVDRLQLSDRHRLRWAQPEQPTRRMTMATIGSFTKTENVFTGEVRTPMLNVKARITPSGKSSENAPDFRIVDFGAAWKKTSSAGREYLSVKLDDPRFPAPIYASLVKVKVEGEEGFLLIWSRHNGD